MIIYSLFKMNILDTQYHTLLSKSDASGSDEDLSRASEALLYLSQ